MNFYKFFLVFVFISFKTLGQEQVVIVDTLTYKPIPYVHVYYANKSKGTYSNKEGVFIVAINTNDTIHTSSVGYKNKSIAIKDMTDTLRLTRENVSLNEIIITHKPKKEFGYHTEKGSFLGTKMEGLLLCQYLVTKKYRDSYISELHYKVKKKKSKNPRLRCHVFSVDSLTQKPLKELLTRDIFVDVSSNKKIITVNIEDQKIKLPPQGIYIGLEWVGDHKDTAFGYLVSEKSEQTSSALMTSLRNKNRFWISPNVGKGKVIARFGISIKEY